MPRKQKVQVIQLTPEEVKTRVKQTLRELLPEGGSNSSVKLSDVNKKLDKDLKSALGLTGKSNTSALIEVLTPYLEDKFKFQKKGNSFSLIRNVSPVDLVYRYIEANPGKNPQDILKALSLSKKEFIDALNELFSHGCLLHSITDKYVAKEFFALKAPDQIGNSETNAEPEPTPAPELIVVNDADKETFRVAFEKLEKHGKFVPILDLRKALPSWSREKFDEVLNSLRGEKIQLHIADQSLMSQEAWQSTFIDDDGTRMGTVTWNEKH